MVKAAPELEAAILFEVPLEKGSEQEVALRASALTAVEQIGFFSMALQNPMEAGRMC